MELSAEAKAIISQANQWTFAGDCSLLQWMQEISQNLEQRVTATGNALQDLNTNVNRTNIHCSNVANSLAALQYTQFVESRVHDDDETIANIAEVPVVNANDQPKSNKEILKTFLQKNLKMLHNCHEKYALDFEDSDEEEAVNNFIYQAKNPYNDRLLPHIYGSKLWKENWHVGLCDGANEYSGDEISEAFSESSTSISSGDNESYETSTGNLSQSTSSISVLNGKYATNIAIQNASSLHGSQSLPFPDDRNINGGGGLRIDANSDSSSTTSRSVAAAAPKSLQYRRNDEHNLFASLQDTPSTSISSSISTPPQQQRQQQQVPEGHKAMNANKCKPIPFFDQIPPDDIFTEPSIPSTSAAKTTADVSQPPTLVKTQIKHKPVNLFDDDDFNSFMTEIVDKTQQTKGNATTTLPTPAVRKLTTKVASTTPLLAANMQENKPVTLFDNSRVEEPYFSPQISAPIVIVKPREEIKKKTVNLFESPEVSPTNEPPVNSSKPVVVTGKTKITAKSLFDDDDDGDDDFLNVFGSKKITNISKTTEKSSLFDNTDMLEEAQNSDMFTNMKIAQKREDAVNTENVVKATEKTLLFDDIDKIEVRKINMKNEDKLNPKPSLKKKIDLFAEDDEENENDLFSTSKVQKRKLDLLAHKEKDKEILKDIENEQIILKDEKKSANENTENKKLLDEITDKKTTTTTTDTKEDNTDLFIETIDDDDLFSKKDVFDSKRIGNTIVVNNPEKQVTNTRTEVTEIVGDITAESIQHRKPTSSIDAFKPSSKEFSFDDAAEKNMKDNKHIETQYVVEVNEAPKINQNDAHKVTNLAKTNIEISTDQTMQLSTANFSTNDIEDSENDSTRDKLSNTLIKVNSPIKSGSTAEVHVTKECTTTASTILHNYAGIFLDEPPDDDDFFQILGSNRLSTSKLDDQPDNDDFFETLGSNRLSTSNLAVDLENDFYDDSALPPPPPTGPISSTTIIQKQETSKTTDTSDYSGLRLFSEIPPDDDNNDNATIITTKTTIDGDTKRLHSVFYDDFSETLEAVRKSNENKQPIHALFDNEPPPDDDNRNFDIFTKVTKGAYVKSALTNDEMDHSVPSLHIPDKIAKLKQDFEHPPPPLDSGKDNMREGGAISKLQMPKININVQALLPGGGSPAKGKSNLKKSFEENTKSVAEAAVGNVFTSAVKVSQPATESNENILSNIYKNRVRIPIKRRPSTRRGRQESYRKSLIAEQYDDFETSSSSNENDTLNDIRRKEVSKKKIGSENVISNDVLQSKTKQNSSDNENAPIPNVDVLQQRNSKQMLSGLLADSNDNEDDFIFNTNKSQQILTKSDKSTLASLISKDTTAVSVVKFAENVEQQKQNPVHTEYLNKTATKMFAVSDDDDVDDLFDSISPRKNASTTLVEKEQVKQIVSQHTSQSIKSITAAESQTAKSLFTDEQTDDSDEDLFKSISTNKTKIVPQQKAGSKKIDTLFDSDNEDDTEFLSVLKKHEKPKSVATDKIKQQHKKDGSSLFSDSDEDDDDLFGGGGSAKSKPSSTKTINKTNAAKTSKEQHPSTFVAPKPTTAKTLKDNPLADLLN